jgi:hypothetical protein
MDRRSVDLLHRACELVRSGWSQHADARSADGLEVQPWQETAVCWSLLGALVAALEELADGRRELPLEGLAAALDALALFVDDDSLTSWNDDRLRSQRDVVTALEAAERSAAARLGDGD